jgi:hypothetical protein
LLDIVLDYRPVTAVAATATATAVTIGNSDSNNSNNNNNNTVNDNGGGGGHPSRSLSRSLSRLASVFWSRSTTTTPATAAATAVVVATATADVVPTPDVSIPVLMGPGPNRPDLHHFSFYDEILTGSLLESIMFNLSPTSLTTLEIHVKYPGANKSYEVDVEKLLETYPYLKDLCLHGLAFRYTPLLHNEDTPASDVSVSASIGTDSTEDPVVIVVQHRLESFTFGPSLLSRLGSDAFLFFKRLGNLKQIRVKSSMEYSECAPNSRPWDFGRALRQFCPKLESIDIEGAVVFWLFDLPILSYDQLPHITSMVEQIPAYMSAIPAELAQILKENRLNLQLLDQEQEELLEGKTAIPFFPQLKRLVFGGDHSLSVQDLFSLGVQAPFLTHLEILRPPTRHSEPWEVYDKDDKNVDSEPTTALLSAINAQTIRRIDLRRRQLRRPFDGRDTMLFLQLCSSLRYLSLTGCSVTIESLVDGYFTTSSLSGGDVGTPYIRPWACEDTLETLKIGFDVPRDLPKEHHAAVWKYLGRFKKLRSLSLVPTLCPRWVLIPTFDHGIEGLFHEGGGMSEALEKLEMVSTWWDSAVGKQMVLWLAKSCPKLRDLNLEYHFLFSDTIFSHENVAHKAFLEDEEVKGCSIQEINVISW